jgi:hypothetical protein
MIDIDLLKGLQITAVNAVEINGYEVWYRYLCRWYSREFHTPLHDVLEMPEEYILSTYFEDKTYSLYHSGTEDVEMLWKELKHNLSTTPEQEQAIDDSDLAFMEEIAKLTNNIAETEAKTEPKTIDPNLNKEESYYLSGEDVDQIPDFIGV